MAFDKGKQHFYLPDICRNTSVLILVVVVEIAAIVVALSFYKNNFLHQFGLTSLYFLWISLVSAFFLCQFRKLMGSWSYWKGFFLAISICVFTFIAVELTFSTIQWYVSRQIIDWSRFTRLLIADLLVSLVVMRIFSLLGLMEWRHKAEINSRMQALQSRIRPHFLFNSLNTIAELTVSQPEQAEGAITSLSTLFRASLDEIGKMHSLEAEIHLCQRYLELEQWRLGDRLDISWSNSVKSAAKWEIPKLLLQPLVENAVVHGVNKSGNINIEIDLRETRNHLSIMVANETDTQKNLDSSGNGMALENIRERLFVLYDDQQAFKFRDDGERFQVIMRLPKRILSMRQ